MASNSGEGVKPVKTHSKTSNSHDTMPTSEKCLILAFIVQKISPALARETLIQGLIMEKNHFLAKNVLKLSQC